MTHVIKRIVLPSLRLCLTGTVVLFLLLSSVSSSVLAKPAAPESSVVPATTALSAASTCTNLIADPGFEAGAPWSSWAYQSNVFGTPICTTGTCSEASLSPHSGTNWLALGRSSTDEIASAAQKVAIPTGTATLKFFLKIGRADTGSDVNDAFVVYIDNDAVFLASATQMSTYASYTEITVPVTAYADGNSHGIYFSAATSGQRVDFNVDDISLCSTGQVVYMPALHRAPDMTTLWIYNESGQQMCYEVFGTGIGRRCFAPGNYIYGTFIPGKYSYKGEVWCGTGTGTIYYWPGEMFHRWKCVQSSSARPGVDTPTSVEAVLQSR